MGHHTAAVLNRDLALVVFKEDPVLIQLLDFAVNFPSWLISRMTFRWSVLRMICGSRLLPMDPPTLLPKLPKRLKRQNRLVGVALSQAPVHRHLSALHHNNLLVELSPATNGGDFRVGAGSLRVTIIRAVLAPGGRVHAGRRCATLSLPTGS
jgi:hypothetical protein